jgi:hypothetical protein
MNAEPTRAQTDASDRLWQAGIQATGSAHGFARSIDELREAVTEAHSAGVPREAVQPIVAGGKSLPGEVGRHLNAIIQRVYCN